MSETRPSESLVPERGGVVHVQTKREIRALLERCGLRPQKRYGQHFLIDGNLMRRLAASAELGPADRVVEVGGGTGALTDLLAARAGHVICIEIDRGLFALLEDRFRDTPHVTLLCGDALESKHRLHPALAEALEAHQPGEAGGREGGPSAVKLVANLPYQVATPLLMNLLIDYPQVRRLCFTVQSEVGERIASPPGGKTYGPLSILAQAHCEISILARLRPHTFWPPPTVDSVMMRMDVVRRPLTDADRTKRFARFLRKVFDHRRKTLRTSLASFLDPETVDSLLAKVDGSRRPASLSVSEWLDLFALLPPELPF